MTRPNHMSGNPLDRVPSLRRDPEALHLLLKEHAHRVLLMAGDRVVLREGEASRALFTEAPAAVEWLRETDHAVLLGRHERVWYWARDIGPPESDAAKALMKGGRLSSIRGAGLTLPADEASIMAHSRAILHFHRVHRFCGHCGSPTASRELGAHRACTKGECGVQVFPRTDPAIIVLIERDDRCLLARQASWPERVYASVAGFVDPGESLEDAVRREVREETGLEVVAVSYRSSQPWPFPTSIMIGFNTVVRGDLVLDGHELEDARWFTREELMEEVEAGRVVLPAPVSISRRLVDDWLAAC